MRLQVEVLRHTLPPVSIIYNTSSNQVPIKTVADFLFSLDRIVPLESADSEWGLEDYVVEVAATSDQQHLYECLHYQFVKDVFREDDEVVVRGLTSDEIRERRQGGRLQILSDGRHLFDGVAWGKRFHAHAQRPGIIIPPRKKRRLLPNEDQDQIPLQLEFLDSSAQNGTIVNNEEDEDDSEDDEDDEYEDDNEDDYSDDYIDEDSEQVSDEDNPEVQPRQIIMKDQFDDADEISDSGGEGVADETREDSIEEDEVQLLLKEAGELEEAYLSLPLEMRITQPSKKRKRPEEDMMVFDEQELEFESFSSPVKERKQNSLEQIQADEIVQDMIGNHVVTEPAENLLGLNGTVGSKTESQKLTNGLKVDIPKVNGVNHVRSGSENSDDEAESASVSESTSSSGESSSEADNPSESSDEDADDSSDTNSDASSDPSTSDSGSSSDSDETSSSGESDSETDSESESAEVPSFQSKKTDTTSDLKQNLNEPATKLQISNPPGTGTKRTKDNNHRMKLRKRLASLKEQGHLPEGAGFDALRAYEAGASTAVDANTTELEKSPVLSELAQKKAEMLARLDAVYDESSVMETQVQDMQVQADKVPADLGSAQAAEPEAVAKTSATPNDGSLDKRATNTSPQKRVRLDIDSSRRMLFNSLGLRVPKTPAAEKELREKLSKPTRDIQSRAVDAEKSEMLVTENDDSWKEKLIISAVECVQEGLILSPPPFPFKQRWEREPGQKRVNASAQTNRHKNSQIVAPVADVEMSTSDDSQIQGSMPKPMTGSRTISAGTLVLDSVPALESLINYPALKQDDIQINAVIAYKELQLGPKFEPEESSYRTAQIITIKEDSIEVIVSPRDRRGPPASIANDGDNQEVSGRISMAIPMEDDEFEDDGLRETAFDRMIDPRLIQAATVQVPSSDAKNNSKSTGSELQPNTTSVTDSILAQNSTDNPNNSHIELDTPRRDEINNMIHGAGFTSTVDEQLLQPIDIPGTHHTTKPPSNKSRSSSKSSHRSGKQVASPKEGASSDWRSSSFDLDVENDTPQAIGQNQGNMQVGVSSPPTVSMVETVDYPHMSHIDINQSSLVDPAGSSSHQDAQRVSPDVSDLEHSDFTHLRTKQTLNTGNEESQGSWLPSEVPQSQLAGFDEKSDASVNLRGGDAENSSDHELDSELDSDGLPSLHALTSSQQNQLSRKKSPCKSSSRVRAQPSPPPLSNIRKKRGTLNHQGSSEPDDENNKTAIKISASQQTSLNLSEVPPTTSVVDLTLSSDPVEPNEKEKDNSDEEYRSPITRRKAARMAKAESSSKRSQVSGRAVKSAFAGLGAKRKLKGKSRSQV